MTTEQQPPLKIRIEPFDPSHHDRAVFSCGTARIDNFLHRTAKKHQKGDFIRVWVAVKEDEKPILGFYSLNAHSVEAEDLPAKLTKNAPNHGGIPALYLAMFGVDETYQGRGLGRVLLADALKRAARVSEEIGLAVVILDVLDDGDAEAVEKRYRFYEAFGFISFPSRRLRMFIPTATILQIR